MKIDIAEWKKVKGYFADKKIDSYMTAIPKLYATFAKDQTAANERIMVNNITALKKEVDRAIKEAKGDKEKLTALDKLMSLIDNGEKQIDADKATHAQALKAHLDLRAKTLKEFKVHEKSVAKQVSLIEKCISDMKNAMKAKSKDETLAQREIMLGHLRISAGLKEDMKQSLIAVRNPTGAMATALKHLSSDAKNNVLVPKTNEIFNLNKAIVTALGKAETDGQKWADNAQKVAPSLN